jgi:hypothetical protein
MPRWYYMTGREKRGPVSLERLRALVAAGVLRPTDEVWQEGSADWLAVASVPELQAAATVAAPDPAPGGEETPATESPPSPSSCPQLEESAWHLFPVVRLRRLWAGRQEFVQVTPGGLVIGRVSGAITEKFLQTTLSRADRDSGIEHISLDRVRRLHRQRVGYLSASSLWTRYTVETAQQSPQFRVSDREGGNVERALQLLLGDRLDPVVRRRPSGGELALMVTATAAAVCLALAWLRLEALAAGAALALITGLWTLALWHTRNTSPARRPEPTRRARRGRAGREPLRSRPLGWLLKLLGLAWVVLLVVLIFHYVPLDEVFAGVRALPAVGPLLGLGVYALCAPGFALLFFGSRLCLRTFGPYKHSDPRAPVVYLRGFEDDGRGTFQPPGPLARLHGIESYWRGKTMTWTIPVWLFHPGKLLRMLLDAERYSAEEVFAAAVRPCGPLVAIGRPGEWLATPGADRMYVPDEKWQRVVLDYLGRCQAVVLQPSNSEGIRWEVEQVFNLVDGHRILLSLVNFRNRPNDYEDFRAWLAERFGVRLPHSIPFAPEPRFVYFERDGTPRIQELCYHSPFLWSFTGNAVDTATTFHSFLQGLDRGLREPPRLPPAHDPVKRIASLLIPASFLLALLAYNYWAWAGVPAR